VGPARARSLAALGIETLEDLLHHYPRRYEDRSVFRDIGSLNDGDSVTVRGEVTDVRFQRMRGRLNLTTVGLHDGTGGVDLLFWNQPFRKRQFKEGDEVIVSGKVDYRRGFRIGSPEVEKLTGDEEEAVIHTGRIVPIYGLTKGITAGAMRRMVWNALAVGGDLVEEYLPDELVRERSLVPLPEAVRRVHFPESDEDLDTASGRLKYDELFLLQCALALRRSVVKRGDPGTSFKWSREMDERIRARLPFTLTGAQDRAVAQITADMRAPEPMSRLLQGDVGSGKTAVAIYAVLLAVANGSTSARSRSTSRARAYASNGSSAGSPRRGGGS
jgi:ATP-dependent DNA helicase RecG